MKCKCVICNRTWETMEKIKPLQCPFCGSVGKGIVEKLNMNGGTYNYERIKVWANVNIPSAKLLQLGF